MLAISDWGKMLYFAMFLGPGIYSTVVFTMFWAFWGPKTYNVVEFGDCDQH